MKQIYSLLIALLIVGSTTAFATHDNSGKKEEVETEVNNIPDFNLNVDLFKVQTPGCGTGGNQNWVFSHYQFNGSGIDTFQKRDCVETIYIYNPLTGGLMPYTYVTTEYRVVAEN